ncbi:Palmitoyltransferase ZDHHC3 [Halotydeus destructor]|nr:Palmitoyltransferase ZDHHC3 [Halotydeus destructor]
MWPRCDPCGLLCMSFVYIITLYSDYAYVRWILWPASGQISLIINSTIYQILVILVIWSHLKASLSDPGEVLGSKLDPLSNQPEDDTLNTRKDESKSPQSWSMCRKCDSYRPPRAHHCRICQKCIRKMDHHCPWINNCVGQFNQKFFIQFLCYVAVMCLYTVSSIAINYSVLKREDPSQFRVLHAIILLMESLVFGIFVVAVLTDQFQAIFSDSTTLERCINTKNPRVVKAKSIMMAEVCGSRHALVWLLPCSRPVALKSNQFVV